VINHGIDQGVVDGILRSAERYFDQPLAAKTAMDASNSPLWRGYISTAAGFHTCKPGTAAGLDHKESFTIGAEVRVCVYYLLLVFCIFRTWLRCWLALHPPLSTNENGEPAQSSLADCSSNSES